MGKVIVGTTMSLDGFMNDRNGDVSLLYPDLEALRRTEMLQEEIQTTGSVVMGRRAYDMAEGDFTDYEFQVPIFVLTHHVPEKATKGENERLTFTFITDGVESALEKAKAADLNVPSMWITMNSVEGARLDFAHYHQLAAEALAGYEPAAPTVYTYLSLQRRLLAIQASPEHNARARPE